MVRIFGWVLGLILLILGSIFLWVTYQQADHLVHHPLPSRSLFKSAPQDFDLQVIEVELINSDKQKLHGYFSGSRNGAFVMLQHGFKNNRSEMFEEAKILQDAGYGILITSIRAHDFNDGDKITFGIKEIDDLHAWYHYLLHQRGAIKNRVGLLGNSLGGSIVINYAAFNQDIAAVVAVSAFSSLQDTINVSVEYFTGLPAFPFAPMISFWAELILGVDVEQVNATKGAASLCNTPLFIMQGGQDIVISAESGQWLYDSACGERTLWFEETLGHTAFDTKRPDEFRRRVIEFFDQSLL